MLTVLQKTWALFFGFALISLGHPAVYYTFNNENKIVCGYCGKIFIRKEE